MNRESIVIDLDDDTRRAIEKDRADEHGHVERWKKMLESGIDR